MNSSSLVLLVTIAVGVATLQPAAPAAAAEPSAKQLVVRATFDPNPPSTKGTNTIVVVVRDASGKPVSGAMVKVVTSMPTMSMKGADIVARERGGGTYTAGAKLDYATTWAFDIEATSKGRSGTMHVEKTFR